MPVVTALKEKKPPRVRTTRSFEEAYARLNASQRQAVTAIEGPVAVISGPGTGKTEVLAVRVSNILKQTQMRPSNILCLTFSVSAAHMMRERLLELIGPDAYGVTVSTFHSFCNDLIASHPHIFGDFEALEQVSDVERFRIVNTIIDQEGELLPLLINRKSPYWKTREILERISELKREGRIDLIELRSIAERYEGEGHVARERRGGAAGKAEEVKAKKFREFLAVFEKYQEALASSQRYDYEDMILTALRALRVHPLLLASLQERYQYILVDEFQDTNGAQGELLTVLTTYEAFDHAPNLFIVGDDDQSIYRFQGANMGNLLSFFKRFPDADVIVLEESFRCTQEVLDAAVSLIGRNTERIASSFPRLRKDLRSSKESRDAPTPQLLLSESESTMPWLTADLIEERLHNGMKPGDIAVLTQTNAELLGLCEILRGRGIQVFLRGKLDLLKHPRVREVIAILRALEDPKDNAKLAGAIACTSFSIHPADLGRVLLIAREKKCALLEALLALDLLGEGSPMLSFVDGTKVISCRNTLLDLHAKVPSRTLLSTLEHLLRECNLLPSPLPSPAGRGEPFDPLEFAPLQEFFDRIKNRSYEDPSYSLVSLLSDLSYYEESQYRDLRMSYEVPHLQPEGVVLLTAHQSKGLEFSTVILYDFRDRHWNHRFHASMVPLPTHLLFSRKREEEIASSLEDERRVCYVSMTRAKEELLLICPKQLTGSDKVRAVSPSSFFAEAGELPVSERPLRNPEQAFSLLLAPSRTIDSEFRAFLEERVKNFSLSVTALNHFLEDPQEFLELDLLRMPQAKAPSLIFGNAVHWALRKWGLARHEGRNLSEGEFLQDFRWYLENREVLTDTERGRLLSLGEESLPRYFRQRLSSKTPVIFKVESVVTAHLGDVPIKGMIDRIDLLEPESSFAEVRDYKTGRVKTELQIREGDYFRQLLFYKILLEESGLPIEAQSFIIDFVGEGSEEPCERVFSLSSHDLSDMRRIIKAVWAKITKLDFTPLR